MFTGNLREGYESENEIGNDCTPSSIASGSLSNTPKLDSGNMLAGQPSGHSRVNYHPHHNHQLQHQQSAESAMYCKTSSSGSDSEVPPSGNLISSKPKIWSLAQTATSCNSSFGRRSPSEQHEPDSGLPYPGTRPYSSAFSVGNLPKNDLHMSGHDDKVVPSCNVTSPSSGAEMECYQPQTGVGWLGGPINNSIPSYFGSSNSMYNNNHVDSSMGNHINEKSPCANNGPINNHIISSQTDTPPQTPPNAHQQQHSSANNTSVDSMGPNNSLMNYSINNNNNNNTALYSSSFHGLKSIFEQSTFIGK